jgi:hypothetical protein
MKMNGLKSRPSAVARTAMCESGLPSGSRMMEADWSCIGLP